MRTPREGLRNADKLPHPLRDYKWLKLPNRVGATDFDFVVERHGHFLMMEQKEGGAIIPTGQQILLHALRTQGWTVWVVRTTDSPNEFRFAEWGKYGEEVIGIITAEDLNNTVNEWFEWADGQPYA